ncbi:MAG: NAD(P)/FAD-dependent oxidoreductase [Magnetococcales bacterium]|nr:NAD(P)/FAD-dependent oxidoreductase [Magnetococcales bacterium]
MGHPEENRGDWDAVIIGAGASGLMCALSAGERKRRVLIIDHQTKPGEKIRISGGGRCNFTNTHCGPERYISHNPKFCISALKTFTPGNFITLLKENGIRFHEKKSGQLFCDGSARQIVDLLLDKCRFHGVRFQLGSCVRRVEKTAQGFLIETDQGKFSSRALVVATGGKSFPKLGASGWGYALARQFGLTVCPPSPALVPLTLEANLLSQLSSLAGISLEVTVRSQSAQFSDAMLFTHRGLSGPAILQLSSYWKSGEGISINLLPEIDLFARIMAIKSGGAKQTLQSTLGALLPKRLVQLVLEEQQMSNKNLQELSKADLTRLTKRIQDWSIKPSSTEGYRTAEVTLGGVDTRQLNSKNLACKSVPGLYFIGEVVDVTGQLGGYNLQWAWSSGWLAGQNL